MGLYNRMIRKFVQLFTKVQGEVIEKELPSATTPAITNGMKPLEGGLEEELEGAGKEFISEKNAKMDLEGVDLSE